MTRTEFYEKYGHIKVSFNSYYKFTFSYYAVLDDNSVLTCDFGGCSDEIYRVYVGASQSILVNC